VGLPSDLQSRVFETGSDQWREAFVAIADEAPCSAPGFKELPNRLAMLTEKVSPLVEAGSLTSDIAHVCASVPRFDELLQQIKASALVTIRRTE
jgi:hypothetical protein